MERITDIYFDDLNDKGKDKILRHYDIRDKYEGNYHVSPVWTLIRRVSNYSNDINNVSNK